MYLPNRIFWNWIFINSYREISLPTWCITSTTEQTFKSSAIDLFWQLHIKWKIWSNHLIPIIWNCTKSCYEPARSVISRYCDTPQKFQHRPTYLKMSSNTRNPSTRYPDRNTSHLLNDVVKLAFIAYQLDLDREQPEQSCPKICKWKEVSSFAKIEW